MNWGVAGLTETVLKGLNFKDRNHLTVNWLKANADRWVEDLHNSDPAVSHYIPRKNTAKLNAFSKALGFRDYQDARSKIGNLNLICLWSNLRGGLGYGAFFEKIAEAFFKEGVKALFVDLSSHCNLSSRVRNGVDDLELSPLNWVYGHHIFPGWSVANGSYLKRENDILVADYLRLMADIITQYRFSFDIILCHCDPSILNSLRNHFAHAYIGAEPLEKMLPMFDEGFRKPIFCRSWPSKRPHAHLYPDEKGSNEYKEAEKHIKNFAAWACNHFLPHVVVRRR